MCRIAGIYNPNSDTIEADVLRMREAMHRGGPDDSGIYVDPNLPLGLGHRRLSLLDLSSAGRQPMQANEGRLQMIYNGEIYNFKEIRRELETLGYQFHTRTDTEVILQSFRQWGKDSFAKFNGMFAIAIWDQEHKEVILARDHAGIKPLYYYAEKSTLIFASEIRAFLAYDSHWENEESWKPLFLLFGHLPEPFTTLKGVHTLGKGEWMSVKLPEFRIEKGHFFKDDYLPSIFCPEAALEVARDVLPKAVERHLVSDAPIGLFLSGGIDSSLLTLLAAPKLKENLRTLSIQFAESEFSEEQYQKLIIDITGANHSVFRVSQKDFEAALPDMLEAMDQPSIDAINTYFISMHAKHAGLKAVLSGLGADEIFGGYPSFNRFSQWKQISFLPKAISRRFGHFTNTRLAKLSFERFHPMLSLYLMNRGLYTVEKTAALTGASIKEIEESLEKIDLPIHINYSSLNANSAMEVNMYMKNQLLKDSDYMSMWHGIEIRVPFLDKELVNAVNRIATHVKFRSDIPKALLIEAFATLLPAEIWNRKKQGFTFPFAYWLKSSKTLTPVGGKEAEVFSHFIKGKVHWSRYWALKVAAMAKFS